jgi:Tfp pilus assembly protein PilF
MLVTLPCTLLLLDVWPLRRLGFGPQKLSLNDPPPARPSLPATPRPWELVMEKIPLLALSMLASWLAADSMKYTGRVISFELVPLPLRIQNALVSFLTYIGKIFWPADLAVIYPFPEAISPWHTALSVLVLMGITVYAGFGLRKRPYLIVGWLWFLGTLVPVSGIIQVGLWPALADRWAYVPSIGLFVMVVCGGYECLERWGGSAARAAAAVLSSVLILALTVVSHRQAAIWETGISLFEHAIDHTAGNFVAHNNLGAELYRVERSEKALFHFHEAARLNSNYFLAYQNLGIDCLFHEKFEEAEAWFAKAVAINPRFAEGHQKMAAAKFRLGKVKEALEHYGLAVQLNPQNKTIHNDFACLLMAIGQPERAIHFFRNALQLDPGYADANHNLGVAYFYLGQKENAERYFEKALTVKPEYAPHQQKLKQAAVSKAE